VKKAVLIVITFIFSSQAVAASDPLPSWQEGELKNNIIKFVTDVSNPKSDKFIVPEARIATFDNDGTLSCEKPDYSLKTFAIEHLRKQAEKQPALRKQQPYKAAYEGNKVYFSATEVDDDVQLVISTFSGISQKEYTAESKDFFSHYLHARFHTAYKNLIYKPMRELVDYLAVNNFKVYMVTGGSASFLRAVAKDLYHIPVENIIGNNVGLKYKYNTDGGRMIRADKLVKPYNNGAGKAENIQLQIGHRPIFTVGNSDGDIEMLEFTESNKHPFMALLLQHDDALREYAYDDGAEKSLAMVEKHGWSIISMKKDFKQIF